MKTNILSKIIKVKKEEISANQKKIPEALLREKAFLDREKRPFLTQLATPGPSGINIIAEIKRASPSKGVFHPDLNPTRLAVDYEQGGAAALSVLTDEKHFIGSAEDLISARNATSLPVLRKDFLISSYQLYESAAMGADAVLLIVRILTAQQLTDYLDLCTGLDLDALVEVHSKKELETASDAGATLIGINNRNLVSFETTIDTAIRMAPLMEPHQIAVAASGIRTRDDILITKESGIFNYLIGESLVKSDNPKIFLRELLR
jgi:indole-3-glycerol phosphate synthase